MVLFEGSYSKTEPTLTPWELQKLMGLGINVGNVLETPFEGGFAQVPTADHFEMFHEAGFANCRIPVCWGNHMMHEEPYTIKPAFLARVEELVKHATDHGMVAVITAHHEWWIDYDNRNVQKFDEWTFKALPRFQALWKQVGEHFKHHRQLLIFGILNEPNLLTDESLNELHRVALVAIRESNPSRVVTISGKDFADPYWLLKNPKALYIPRDPQLMLEVHATDPHGFAGANPSMSEWGSLEDQLKVKDWVDRIELYGRARNLPIYVAEFGCSNHQSHDNGRLAWIRANWEEIRRKGFCASLWDDGDRFSIYNRENGQWEQEVLVALQRSLPGLKGVSMNRSGGGLGGDSNDPTVELQRRLELCFSRLGHAVQDLDKLTPLADHAYGHENGAYSDEDDDSQDDESTRRVSLGGRIGHNDSTSTSRSLQPAVATAPLQKGGRIGHKRA